MKMKYESLDEDQATNCCVTLGAILAFVVLTLFSIGKSYTTTTFSFPEVLYVLAFASSFWVVGFCANVFNLPLFNSITKNVLFICLSLVYMAWLFLQIYNGCDVGYAGQVKVYNWALPVEAYIFCTTPYILGFYSSKRWD